MTSDLIIEPRAVPFTVDDPAAPAVGKWYWLKTTVEKTVGWTKPKHEDDEPEPIKKEIHGKEFVCVIHIGSNYVEVQGLERGDTKYPDRPTWRIHFDDFADECEWIVNPQAIIRDETSLRHGNVIALMQEIRDVTARLAITPGLGLPGASVQPEAQGIGLVLAKGKPATEYKTSLVKAQKETLPQLFKRIEAEHAEMARWMGAPLIPMRANAKAMEPAIEAIEDRLFSVELYAGLCEEVVKVKDGEPAKLQEKIRLFQRRAYMDEECLAQYEHGGMDFKGLKDFDRWLCKPAQLERLMPFPRCVLAFQVRRNVKHREDDGSLAAYFRISEQSKLDKLTFLYIRNGGRVYRLSTEIDFDMQLFPDMRREEPNGKLYAIGAGAAWILKGENELRAMREDYEKRHAEWKVRIKKVPKEDRWEHSEPRSPHDDYEPFDQTNVNYDDISKWIASEMTRHNRLVLVLQGILDRSEALHPHPPWSLWRQDSFETAIELVYDDDRALTPGAAPDFEAYRAANLAKLKVGDVTLGQEDIWSRVEASKEAQRERQSRRGFGGRSYTPDHYFPPGNPGPGKFAHVVALRPERCVFQWVKRRRGNEHGQLDPDKPQVGVKITIKREKLFNISAYKPGDFRQFFADPRTRADYLKWAPLLLEAEEFHAGNREVTDVKPLPPRKQREPGGSYEYRQRKERLAWLGRAVRLKRDVSMKHGSFVNKKGTLWRVMYTCRSGGYKIVRIDKTGKQLNFESSAKMGTDAIDGLDTYSFEWATEVPPEPKEKTK